MTQSTSELRRSVIEAALQAAGIREVRIEMTADGACILSGCVSGSEQEAVVHRLIENAGVERICGELTHISEVRTEVDVRVHKVEAGETWWTISARFYGDGRHHLALREANGNPNDLVVGDVIVIANLD